MASGASLERHFPTKHATGRQNKTPVKFRDEDTKQACAFGKTTNQRPFPKNQRSFSKQQESGGLFGSNKRRYSHSGVNEQRAFKRRRRDMMIPPTKFLLGGNINDPLNLESLADEEVNKKMNEVTPYSSPLPAQRHQEQIEVLIPQNINDPLNLNSGEDIEFKLMSPKSKRRKKHNKKKKNNQQPDGAETGDEKEPIEAKVIEITPPKSVDKPVEKQTEKKPADKKVMDKIVSPVVPQGVPSKFTRRNRTRSFSHSDEKAKGHSKKRKRISSVNKTPRFRPKDEAYQYGNYDRYYGYRNMNATKDFRIQSFKGEWFQNKDVLDVGCNVGHLTLTVARDFNPKKLIGIDIDDKLIKMAQRNVRHYLSDQGAQEFPISMALCHGPIAATALQKAGNSVNFPNNVFFVAGNYVPESDALLELQRPEFDTILCLSLTKWIHLNWGDDGLKRMFRRIFLQLRPGGKLILEAQLWPSYAKKKKLTERTYQHYNSIQFKPDQFNEYLLGKDVGFSTCELVTTPAHPSKGFCRPMYVFTKSECSSVEDDHSQRGSSTSQV